MTFDDLLTELYARGSDYLNQNAAGRTRAKRFINEAYLEDVCADEPWDFLRTTTSGTAPLTVSDLDTVISVRDSTRDEPLTEIDPGLIEDLGIDLADTGEPTHYYFTGETTIDVYPANTTNTIAVRYFKIPAELSGGTDTPLVPSRWQGIIVDAAFVRVLIDDDEYETAAFLQQRVNSRLDKMRSSSQARTPHPSYILGTAGGEESGYWGGSWGYW